MNESVKLKRYPDLRMMDVTEEPSESSEEDREQKSQRNRDSRRLRVSESERVRDS